MWQGVRSRVVHHSVSDLITQHHVLQIHPFIMSGSVRSFPKENIPFCSWAPVCVCLDGCERCSDAHGVHTSSLDFSQNLSPKGEGESLKPWRLYRDFNGFPVVLRRSPAFPLVQSKPPLSRP